LLGLPSKISRQNNPAGRLETKERQWLLVPGARSDLAIRFSKSRIWAVGIDDLLLGSSSWAPVIQTVIGAVIGAFGAIAGGAFGSWFTWQKERQSKAAAFAGEVQGLIEVVNWRECREGILAGQKFPIDEPSISGKEEEDDD
jgi:hypothetical protein